MLRSSSSAPLRPVVCYHCSREVALSAMARTATCPRCSQRLQLDDLVVQSDLAATKLETCGRLVIGPRARVTARVVRASASIEVSGSLKTGSAATAGFLFLGPGAEWAGDCRAAELVVHPGAIVRGGAFRIVPGGPACEREERAGVLAASA